MIKKKNYETLDPNSKVNCTFDHGSNDLLNQSTEAPQNNSSIGIRKRSYRVLNRNYVRSSKSIKMGSENRSIKKLNKLSVISRNNTTIDNLTNNYESTKVPKSSSNLHLDDDKENIRNSALNNSKIYDNYAKPVISLQWSLKYGGNKTINLDNKANQRLNKSRLLNYSDLDISDSKLPTDQNNKAEVSLNKFMSNDTKERQLSFKQFKFNLVGKVKRGSKRREFKENTVNPIKKAFVNFKGKLLLIFKQFMRLLFVKYILNKNFA